MTSSITCLKSCWYTIFPCCKPKTQVSEVSTQTDRVSKVSFKRQETYHVPAPSMEVITILQSLREGNTKEDRQIE